MLSSIQKMKLIICVLSVLVTGCMASIITEYKYLQQDGNFTEPDMLQCQLRANGNTNVCAVRVNTTTTHGIIHDTGGRMICELLSLAWCYSPVFEPGYTYSGKKTVSHTPPYTFYNYNGGASTWEIWETIPMAVIPGAAIRIVFTASTGAWSKIRLSFYTAAQAKVCDIFLYPNNPITPGVKSSLVATIAASSISVNVEGQTHTRSGSIADIRIIQFVFFDIKGEIHLVSYRAAPW